MNGLSARNFAELFQCGLRFRNRIQRQWRLVLAVAFLRDVLRVLFLQVGRVGKQELAKFVCRCVRVKRATISQAHESRNVTGVVDVRVRQHHPVDGRRINGRLVPVALLELVRALKQAAVHQQSLAFRFH